MSNQQTMEFQAEVKQLLDIVINSLYTDKEIFLRELISNASDALEKFRYVQLTSSNVINAELPLQINITTDEVAHTLSIYDSGIGMTKEELIQNLGTIAHSGSKAFIKHLKESDPKDINLIGQFGVGFYSAFMAADKVTVYTKSFQEDAPGCLWISEGVGSYNVSEVTELERGTKIILHLKNDAHDFSKLETIKRIIKQYSGFVPFPVLLNNEKVNTIQAVWTKNKNEVTPEEYTEFYKYIANAYDEPLMHLHFTADAPLDIKTVLFVPKFNLELGGFGRMEPGVSLYCRKVLIQQKSEDILPEWLRFVRGVIDSEELPLNISRETMQDSALVAKLKKVITGRFLKYLNEQSETDKDRYKEFLKSFGTFLKEGAATDYTHRNELVKLLRFESSKEKTGELVSLKDYIGRAQEGQKNIYYINGPNREIIENGPYMEVFKKQDIEVIYTKETVDDYIFDQLGEYEGMKLTSADQADLDMPDLEENVDSLAEEEMKDLTEWLKTNLDDKVTEVRVSKRLSGSPALVLNPTGISNSMQRMMQMMNKDSSNNINAKIFEINVSHSLIKRLNDLRKTNDEFGKMAAEQLLANALMAAGLVDDPRGMVTRMNQILERAIR